MSENANPNAITMVVHADDKDIFDELQESMKALQLLQNQVVDLDRKRSELSRVICEKRGETQALARVLRARAEMRKESEAESEEEPAVVVSIESERDAS